MNENEFDRENKNNFAASEDSEKTADGCRAEDKLDSENHKDIEKGEEENGVGTEEKEQTAGAEEKADAEKEKADEEKVGGSRSGGAQGTVNGGYSANYNPPFYVPNFTEASVNGKKEKKKYGAGIIALMCAVCAVISTVLGAAAGLLGGGVAAKLTSDGADIVNIVKSDREITVNEIPGNTGYSDLTVAQVAALVGKSVVEITTTHMETSQFYGQYVTSGAGSGVLISQADGYAHIVTNYHVIDDADDITVRVKFGEDEYKSYTAEYVGGDSSGDLAVLRIEKQGGESFTTVVFGDSDKLIVGEEVVAIGNPLGSLGGTVTNGIISAKDREITVEDNTMTLLQTNTAINPGNSGGGLFNMAGELIGIVNAKQSSTGIEGLGFAIPSNKVRADITDIMTLGYVSGRATLGITVAYGTYQGITGVYVTDAGSTAFKQYDRITKIGDYDVSSIAECNAALKKLTIGTAVDVKVARGGRWETVSVTVLENTNKY